MNKQLIVYEDSKIYIPCPANHVTGGTELVHQFVYNLRKLGFNAFVFYYKMHQNVDPIPENFKKYVTDYAVEIEDNSHNILVVPETRTEYLFKFQHIRKVIWWLSVDFYYDYADIDRISTLLKLLRITKKFNINKPGLCPVDLHLVQSNYAADHLEKHGISNYRFLSDYLNEEFFQNTVPVSNEDKVNCVLYNPKKGYSFTKDIIALSPGFEWVPIINMSTTEVVNLLRVAKVYIDFGKHPGKDRFPREAAICGCCVITGLRGAAKFEQDIPIPASYKFEDKEENIALIIEQIEYCLFDYQKVKPDFDAYREVIMQEEKVFIQQLQNIFVTSIDAVSM